MLWTGSLAQSDLSKLADSLYAEGHYRQAALWYGRAVFEEDQLLRRVQLEMDQAQAYKQLNDFERALEIVNSIKTTRLPDSLVFNIYHERILLNYLTYRYQQAKSEIQLAHYYITDSLLANELLYLEVLVHNELHDWEEAKKAMGSFIAWKELPDSTASFYEFLKSPGLKSPQKARRLSTIFPGLGQFYAGQAGAGIASLALTLGSAAFGVWQILESYYIAGIGTGGYLLLRFYTGGRKNAEFLAKQYNDELIRHHLDRIEEFIIKHQ